MKPIKSTIFAAGFVTLVIVAWFPGHSSLAAGPPDRPKWEYATLSISGNLIWVDPERHYNESNDVPDYYNRLAKDLGGTLDPSYGLGVQLLNIVGAQGWELMAVDSAGTTFYFKRTAR